MRSIYRGVYYASRAKNPWRALVTVGTRQIYVGIFSNQHDAAIARDRAAVKHGCRTKMNFPELSHTL
jgi:hypothetical protein